MGKEPPALLAWKLGARVDTYSNRRKIDPAENDSNLKALWQDPKYIQVLAKLLNGRAKFVNWLKNSRPKISSVNIQEAFDSAISALECAIVSRRPYANQIAQAGFPYAKIEQRIFDLALRAVDALTKPRAMFRSNIGNRKQVGLGKKLAVDELVADTANAVAHDLIDELADALDTEIESAQSEQTSEIAESTSLNTGVDYDEQVNNVWAWKTWLNETEIVGGDSVLEGVLRAERLKRLEAFVINLRKEDPCAYHLIRLRLAYDNSNFNVTFYAFAAEELNCREDAAKQRWHRALNLVRGSLKKVDL